MRIIYSSYRQKWWPLIIAIMIALLPMSCTEDPILDEVQEEVSLKAFNMLPEYQIGDLLQYKGLINNDSIEILIPPAWNGMFIVYAHGYVDPNRPIALPNDVIAGTPVKYIITEMGFAYGASSYSQTGFAVKEAVTDVLFLGNMIKAHFKPAKIFLGGVSEGGLVAVKTLERKNQKTFDAGLVSCGPIGDFEKQIQYLGDFHVLFNYLYAQELQQVPGGPISLGTPEYVDPAVMTAWSNGSLDAPLLWVISQVPEKIFVLFELAKVPYANVPASMYPLLVKELLRFNIMATNDLIQRVHGVPYDNTTTVYTGAFPFNFAHLNDNIQRIKGDKQAYHRIKKLYETNGNPGVPIVIMHTAEDHVTPSWHVQAYLNKVDPTRIGSDIYYQIYPVPGHCNYQLIDIYEKIQTMVQLSN